MTDFKLEIDRVLCKPYSDQRPGTAGLRKKVGVFQQPHYLESFVQAIFDTLQPDEGAEIIVGGDGRYYNREAIQIIAAIAAANGIGKIFIGEDGLLSTPAASHLIRCKHAAAGIILTASHNPGGPDGDFGIKFNIASGGQATEQMTEAVFERSKQIDSYLIARLPAIDLGRRGEQRFGRFCVEVVDPVEDYAELMEQLFDFELIRAALKKRVTLHFDALNAATGPYAQRIFCDMLGAPSHSVANCTPLEDFGGLHPDPNPVDAKHLLQMALGDAPADLIAASDGDGDRNMILGPGMMVSPGDSLAIILANTAVTPGYRSGVPGVARSMPTSRAVDAVARELNIPCYETPTGWRFFSNLLESGRIGLCGEESFGTSSAHAREKDGLWAVLFWLNLLAAVEQPLNEIVHRHWKRFGRCFFQRRDYFIPDAARARDLMDDLQQRITGLANEPEFGPRLELGDVFSYTDPVDGSISTNQGVRAIFRDGGRIVYRLSGTGTSGATLRVYLDKIETDAARQGCEPGEALGGLAAAAAAIGRIEHFTGLAAPTAII
jgi:phosphoglucomutase